MGSVQSAAVAGDVSAVCCNFQTYSYLIVFIDLFSFDTKNSAPKQGLTRFFCAFSLGSPEDPSYLIVLYEVFKSQRAPALGL
jgi:hypothetical protein